ncbi:MAG: biotin synthase BioB [Candidatus Omnitrophota bacterium]
MSENLVEKILSGQEISKEEARGLLETSQTDLPQLFSSAEKLCRNFQGDRISLCSITSAKTGKCPEDCAFCSQSSYHQTQIVTHPLISLREILERCQAAFENGADRFCIVISGRGIESEEELEVICRAFSEMKTRFPQLRRDGSLGTLNRRTAEKLKAAGLERYNHNLETTEKFFPNICTTHTFADRLKTIQILKELGIEVCCGGIFGLGEAPEDRIEFAFTLKELDVDCVPLNFLNPIAGTRLGDSLHLDPWELLKTVAVLRFILPQKEIRICGGRQQNLKDLQYLIYSAGANAIISGNYLTTSGTPPEEDIATIHRLGLKTVREEV